MGILRRILAALVLILAAVGFIGCIGGIVGIWMLCADVSERVEKIEARIAAPLERVSEANQRLQSALAKAHAEVNRARDESAQAPPENKRPAARLLRRLIRERLAPRIDDLGGRLATFSDATVVAVSLLQDLQELPFVQGRFIGPNKLEHATDQASRVSAVLQNLRTVIGDDAKESPEEEIDSATDKVTRVLEECETTVNDWQTNLNEARSELSRIKAEILDWLLYTAITVTALCVWMGLGQVSLFAHAWKWLRHK